MTAAPGRQGERLVIMADQAKQNRVIRRASSQANQYNTSGPRQIDYAGTYAVMCGRKSEDQNKSELLCQVLLLFT
jgi:hypothetical protein